MKIKLLAATILLSACLSFVYATSLEEDIQPQNIMILKGHKVDSPKITPRFGIRLPITRMIFKVIENNNGVIKVDFFVQNNVMLGKCTEGQGNSWNCPVTSLLWKMEELELRDNYFVYLKDTRIGALAIEYGNDSVILAPGYEILPYPIDSGFVLKFSQDAISNGVSYEASIEAGLQKQNYQLKETGHVSN